MIKVIDQTATSYFPAVRKKDGERILRRVVCEFVETNLSSDVLAVSEELSKEDKEILRLLVEKLFMPKSLLLFGGKGHSVEKIGGLHDMFIYRDRSHNSYQTYWLGEPIELSNCWYVRFIYENHFGYAYGKTFRELGYFHHRLGSWNSTFFSAGRLRHAFSVPFDVYYRWRKPFPIRRILRYIGRR